MIRALNIALRTAHIGAMGILLGGYAFEVAGDRLLWALWFTVGTGLALAALESGGRLSWLHEVRGVMNLAKVGLFLLVPVAGEARLPILLTVVVLGSLASHMPKRFRHYSLLRRQVIDQYPDAKG
jgi:hypothetical protein